MRKKRAKRILLIDIRVPSSSGYRMTIRGDDTTVSADVLDKWIPICEALGAEAVKHFTRKPDKPNGTQRAR